jgi:hypothetical protein
VERKKEKKLTYHLTYKDVIDILEIIDYSTHGELHLELEDLKLTVVKRRGDSLSATAKEEI